MASESVPYLARLRPLITAKLAVWGLVTRETSDLDLAKLYPDLNIVIAHYGNPWIVDATAVAARNPNVYIDLSGLIEGECKAGDYLLKNRAYTNYIGMWMNYLANYEKFLFGTDWPLVDPAEYASVIKHIVPESEHEKIFYTNALKVFPLPKEMVG